MNTKGMLMGLVAISLAGCAAGEPEEMPDVNWDAVEEEGTIPQAAAEIMAATAGTSNVAPQYYACPAFVAYRTRALADSGSTDPNWDIPTDWYFAVNQVTWAPHGSPNLLLISCGASSFLHLMNVSRTVPGMQCSTSADTPQADGNWFVCW